MTSRRSFLVALGSLTFGAIACQSQSPQVEAPTPSPSASPAEIISLYGAGATFPSFLYLKWLSEYHKLHPNIQISYQPVGSAAGIQQFISSTVDFAATDVPLSLSEEGQVSKGAIALPMTGGSIAVVYNLPGVKRLKLSRQVLASIFLGDVKKWNDPKIAATNPGVKLPNQPILVIHRADGSGTTAAFTAHLSTVSSTWRDRVGTGLSVAWKTGTGIKDNAGISAQIQQTEGTIGYVEYAFAKQLNLATVALENKAGKFVLPTEQTAAAALSTVKLSEDLRGSVPDPDGGDSYPIVTYSWLLLYKKYDDPQQAKVLKDLIEWGVTEGQKFAPELGYVPLPAAVVEQVKLAATEITS